MTYSFLPFIRYRASQRWEKPHSLFSVYVMPLFQMWLLPDDFFICKMLRIRKNCFNRITIEHDLRFRIACRHARRRKLENLIILISIDDLQRIRSVHFIKTHPLLILKIFICICFLYPMCLQYKLQGISFNSCFSAYGHSVKGSKNYSKVKWQLFLLSLSLDIRLFIVFLMIDIKILISMKLCEEHKADDKQT